MRKFLIALVILVVLLVVLDRAGLAIAERQIGSKVQTAYSLPQRPGVSIHGFPFLTQVASGHYQEIDGVQLRDIRARFTGVRAPLSLLFGQGSGSVIAAHATATALLPYAQVERRLPRGITLAAHDGTLRVTGRTPLGSLSSAVSLGVTSRGISVTGGAFGARFSYVIPLGQLPLHLSVTGVRVAAGGVVIVAAARNVAFTKP
jgi:hypothetical protein